MKHALLGVTALLVVLAAHAWVVVSAMRNRSAAPGGTLELTERELPLRSMPAESTVVLLRLSWWGEGFSPEDRKTFNWLDPAKLTELGFDCRVPPTDSKARQHYRAMPPRSVFVVLALAGEAPSPVTGNAPETSSRLTILDAGRDPVQLRAKYPDPSRHGITRAVVRALLLGRSREGGESQEGLRLQGWVERLLPGEIFVPRPHSEWLRDLDASAPDRSAETRRESRYAVTLSWGANFEPWIRDVRPVSPDPDASANP
jgi:hypothetical protein